MSKGQSGRRTHWLRRGRRVVVSLAIVLAAYRAYALVAVPWIEPPAAAPIIVDDGRGGHGDAIDRRIELLRPLFTRGDWEIENPKILESDQVKLLFQDYRNLGDGRVEVRPSTIILTSSRPDLSDEQRLRQAVVLQAPEGALLQFDRPFNLRRMDIGRLVAGHLVGRITIRRRGAQPQGAEDLLILTRDIHMTEREAWTPHPVEFRFGPHFGRGEHLQIKLLPGESAASRPHRGPNIGGIESLEVRRVERLHLELGQVAAPGPGGGFGVRPSRPQSSGQDARAPGPASRDLPVEITCRGPFRFDLIKQVATFEDRVNVWRIQPNGRNDQLACELLSIFFTERGRPSAANQAAGEPPPKSAGGGFDLAPQRLEARGNPVVVDAPSEKLHSQAERLEYDLSMQRLVLDGTREVFVQQGPNEIHARSLQYQSAGPGRLGQVAAAGPGWLRGQMAERPGQPLQARWQEQLRIRPHEENQLISLIGGAELTFHQFGQLAAGEIHLWLWEAPPEGKAEQARLRPDRMLAREQVRVASPQLSAAVERMEIWFEGSAAAGGGKWRSGEPAPALQPTAYRQPAEKGSELFSPPLNVFCEYKPGSENSSDPFSRPSAPRPQQFDVVGRLLRARVLVQENQQAELAELVVEDGVRLTETQAAASQEPPSMLVSGQRLQVVDADKLHAAVTVTGEPAQFEGRGMVLSGPNINLNRGTNRLWIDGPGWMELPMDRDLEGNPLPKGGRMRIDWRQRMHFDGRTARFEQSVSASTPRQLLRTETLEAQLQRTIRFADAQPGQSGQPGQSAQLEQILCRGGVLLDSRSFDPPQQTSYERAQLVDLAVNLTSGALTGGGPGWVISVRRGATPALPGSAGNASAPATQQPEEPLNCLQVRFQGSITGNLKQQWLSFHDQVQTAYAPVDRWEATLAAERPEALGPPGVVLHCDHLSVHQAPTPLADRKAMELEAAGNVIAEGNALMAGRSGPRQHPPAPGGAKDQRHFFTARGVRMTYAEAKDLLVLEGDGRSDAELFRQQQLGGPTSKAAARKILYWPKTNKLWIDGARSLEMTGAGMDKKGQ